MTKKSQEETVDKQNISTLTSEEKAIVDRIASADDEWKEIRIEHVADFSLSEDPYKLPPEAKQLQDEKKFAFRWIEKKTDRIDEVKSWDPPKKWWIVNSTQPDSSLKKYVDPMFGGIIKRGQILVFKPWWMHRLYQDLKMQSIAAKDAAGDISKKDGLKTESAEWLSGPHVKIGGNDQVFDEDTGTFSTGDGVEEGD